MPGRTSHAIDSKNFPVDIIPSTPTLPFLKIHGNITYNFNYRSYIDTPFAEHDLMQHGVQTRFALLIKNKYPLTVFLTSRRSNSSFFSNATDVSVRFNRTDMLENIKAQLRNEGDVISTNKLFHLTPSQIYQQEIQGIIPNVNSFSFPEAVDKGKDIVAEKTNSSVNHFKALYASYKSKMDKLNELQKLSKFSLRDQDLVGEREKKLRGNT